MNSSRRSWICLTLSAKMKRKIVKKKVLILMYSKPYCTTFGVFPEVGFYVESTLGVTSSIHIQNFQSYIVSFQVLRSDHIADVKIDNT